MHTRTPDLAEGAPSASAHEDPLAAAQALLAEHEQQRMQACSEELQAVLAKHGMRLDVTPPQIAIVPQ